MLLSDSIVFATNNDHKTGEVKALLPGFITVLGLKDMGCTEDIPETAATLEGNALMKARFVYSKYGRNCFADDTGLEVAALGGAPGIHSARYAGNHDSEANMVRLLSEMKGVADRRAQFRTVIALILDGQEHIFEGIVQGRIAEERRDGVNGFGYDPLFIPEGFTESFAEMPLELKNSMSHRGRAIQKLIEFLNSKLQ